jgi:hypothetical protein
MKLSELVKTGIQQRPPRIILQGPHGIGKSTFGANAPSPIFIPTEDGLTSIDVPHIPVAKKLDDVWQYMTALIKEDHDYKTVVIDTVDWLETLIFSQTCSDGGKTSIEDFGYAKGYVFALKHWERLVSGLTILRDKGMAVLLLAHSEIKPFNPPDSPAYDRYQIAIHKAAAAMLEEYSDAVLFVNYKVFVTKDGLKNKATGGERIIYTSPNPAYRAKNRYGFPEEMPFSFAEIMKEIKKTYKGEKTDGRSKQN